VCLNIAGVLYVGTLEAEVQQVFPDDAGGDNPQGDGEEMTQEEWIQGAVKEEEEDEAAPSGFFELLMMS
jgi:hypothetical protein